MYATNSLRINFTPNNDPASCISEVGMPMHHATGANTHPANLSSVIGSSEIMGNRASNPVFTRVTIVIKTNRSAAILRVI